MEKVYENTKNSIRLTIYNIKYYDSKSYTYLISKQSKISSNVHDIVHFHSFHLWNRYEEMEGIHALENWKIRFLLALFQPSIHPSRGKALETSPKKNTPFAFERGTYELFSSSNACMLIYAIFSLWEERQNGARHPFPTFNLNIRRVFYLRPWMGQVCSDAEKKEDDTYRWPLIFHGKEC